jgi:hypothetical protein
MNSRILRSLTIFAPSHGAHSYAKILFAFAEKDVGAKSIGGVIIYTTIMRTLRHKHGISLVDLARCARVSPQYISGIELGEFPATDNAKRLAKSAFERLIEYRQEQTSRLAEDLAVFSGRLLDPE